MSLNTLTNNEIDEILKTTKNYKGCFSKSYLPKLTSGGYIVNLDDSAGTHWCLLYIKGKNALWIDSYGMPPPNNVLEQIKNANKKLLYSTVKLQSVRTNSCGWFCIAIFEMLNSGKSIASILYDFFFPNKPLINESKLKKYFKNKKN